MSCSLLTTVEIDALRWSMDAKGPGDIARIMRLPEHEVRVVLHSAMRKLDCPTKYQAVLKAIRLGLLQ